MLESIWACLSLNLQVLESRSVTQAPAVGANSFGFFSARMTAQRLDSASRLRGSLSQFHLLRYYIACKPSAAECQKKILSPFSGI